MERPETGKSYFYIFNFLPYRHEFTNWTVTGVDAQYEPDNWAKAINSTRLYAYLLLLIRFLPDRISMRLIGKDHLQTSCKTRTDIIGPLYFA